MPLLVVDPWPHQARCRSSRASPMSSSRPSCSSSASGLDRARVPRSSSRSQGRSSIAHAGSASTGGEFTMFKFRKMRRDAAGPRLTVAGDDALHAGRPPARGDEARRAAAVDQRHARRDGPRRARGPRTRTSSTTSARSSARSCAFGRASPASRRSSTATSRSCWSATTSTSSTATSCCRSSSTSTGTTRAAARLRWMCASSPGLRSPWSPAPGCAATSSPRPCASSARTRKSSRSPERARRPAPSRSLSSGAREVACARLTAWAESARASST